MLALKVCALLSLTLFATGSDLDVGLEVMACLKTAITKGVPSLNIPSHDPFVPIRQNFSWTGDVQLAKLSLKTENMVVSGIPNWTLTAAQLSFDSEPNATFKFTLSWDSLSLSGDYHVNVTELLLHQSYNGKFEIVWKKSTWSGTANIGKPTSSSNGTVNDVQILWNVDDVGVTVNGLGASEQLVETTLSAAIKTGLNTDALGNVVGDFAKRGMTNLWNTGRVWKVVDWCNSNMTSDSFY